ncbi:MAG: acyl dehydratase [Gammaproteobacteria bacterium]|nr:acyl dehydratase [Gammaproteobacteria bacterium]
MHASRTFDSVTVGDELQPIAIPITLQRLVMEAGANRDFSLIHHDRDVAKATGAPDAYMNTFFIAGMFERLLREWMGQDGRLNKITGLRMNVFNAIGDTVTFCGKVARAENESRQVEVELWSESEKGKTVTATATVTLP